jgi:exodeoxyribonuclease V alpha subunit
MLSSNAEMSQIRAEIERISYRNEENGWTVLKARNCEDQSQVTAVGHFAAVQPGAQFEFFGTWGKHPQYGAQFKIERVVPIRPSTVGAIERYLCSGMIKGIGPKTAHRIVSHFGDQTLRILDDAPQRLGEVPSLGQKKADAIIQSWQEQRTVADVMMFLNNHGISPLFAARIYRHYGPDAIAIVSADPYKLAMDIHGIGFVSADKIAQSMGIAPDSPERIRAAILYQLQQAEERGHCYVTSPQLVRMLVESLGLVEEKVIGRMAECLHHLTENGMMVSEDMVDTKGEQVTAHFRSDILVAEWNVAHCAGNLLAHPMANEVDRVDAWLERYAEASQTQLSDEQMDAVRKAANHRVFILTGGPGVGKTTTANTIIRLLKAMGKTVALGAPTGRAAQRLTEVAATPARTIHRMLEWQPHMRAFARDENNPLTVQAVIIDEASMLDIRLADALMRAVPKTAQLILIGDVDQLPSVGPGNVLRDLITSSRVPYTRLSRIFRQAAASRIVQTAHAINKGESPDIDQTGATDCQFIECLTVDDVKAAIRDLVTDKIPKLYGFDPVSETQILSPMNRGDLGTVTLSEELQLLLNPPHRGMHEYRRASLLLRPGDKVIQSVNNYDLGVFNGDIGYVQETKVDGGKLIVTFGDRPVTYEDEDVLDLRLAYAITIHKSQGSEFPVVIIPCTMQHYVMLQRNLIYTALTRAKKLAFFVGSRKALLHAARNTTSTERQTSLIDKITRVTSRR